MDHCDPDTLLPMLISSPQAKVIGPYNVIAALLVAGMDSDRGIPVSEDTFYINDQLRVMSLPAAHPVVEHDGDGHLMCLGFVVEYLGKRIYHSGDTSPSDLLIYALRQLAPIDVALLPINEKNFYRDKAGIVGNMSIREAFGMAVGMMAKIVVPMHYDMFKPNQAYLDELVVVYRELQPPFALVIEPSMLVL
jgi:L-ascorbate metabolism protein UlaG (beta-lactamase superfamily)